MFFRQDSQPLHHEIVEVFSRERNQKRLEVEISYYHLFKKTSKSSIYAAVHIAVDLLGR